MPDYVGDAETIGRQKAIRALAEAGLPRHFASGGRTLIYVEPSEETWAEALTCAEDQGLLTLPNMPRAEIEPCLATRFDNRWTPRFWDALEGDADAILNASRPVMADTPLPEGWTIKGAERLKSPEIEAFQTLNAACGVSANPAYMMQGDTVPGFSTLIRDGDGRLMACAWLGMLFHPDSRLGGTGFAGLVSVAPEARGLGLGKHVNARLLVDSHAALGWRRVTEFVAADNPASRGMVQACGLTHDAGLVTCVMIRGGGYFTR